MSIENKEYVSLWVTKETAAELKKLQSGENEKLMVEEVAKKLQLNIESELRQLDDDLARYKAACVVFKQSLMGVYSSQQEEIEKVIDNMWDIMPKVKSESKKLVVEIEKEISPLKQQLDETAKSVEQIKTAFNNINFYAAERMVDLVVKINQLDDGSKEILKFLMNEYQQGE
jgi:hypothetical protein